MNFSFKSVSFLFVTVFFSAFLSVQPVFAQETWVWQNPLPQGNVLHDVFVIDQSTAVAVGENGTFLKTTDAGQNWMYQIIEADVPGESPPRKRISSELRSVHFIDTNTGWIAGFGKTLLKTTDGGQTWSMQELPGQDNPSAWDDYGYDLFAIQFIDRNTGYAVGSKSYWENSTLKRSGGIIKTTDGGDTWIDQPSGTERFLYDIHFTDAEHGWAVGGYLKEAVLLQTADGGSNWIPHALDGEVADRLTDVDFTDSDHGWIIGGVNLALQTQDGGVTWNPLDLSSTPSALFVTSIDFVNADTGWLIGSELLKTTDGGQSWNPQPCQYRPGVVQFLNTDVGWAVGNAGLLYHSSDGGATWTNRASAVTYQSLNCVHFVNSSTGWAVGDGATILKTSNSGQDWVQQTIENAEIEMDGSFFSVFFFDENNGWAAGTGYQDHVLHGQVYHTTDGGNHWQKQWSVRDEQRIAVCFADQNTGWVVGRGHSTGGSRIFRTTDGGEVWEEQTNPVSETSYFTRICCTDVNTAWIGTDNGVVLNTTDGGVTWQKQETGMSDYIYSIFFIDAMTGWIAGTEFLLKSIDGGETWFEQNLPGWGSPLLSCVHFADANNGWAVGSLGSAFKTGDGGMNWVDFGAETTNDFNSVFVSGTGFALAVGDNGMIQKRYTSSVNAAPQIVNISDFAFDSEDEYGLDLNQCVNDANHQPTEMTWQVTSSEPGLNIQFAGHLVGFTAHGWTGEADVTFTVTDPQGASDQLTVRVTVTVAGSVSVNRPGRLVPETYSLEQNYPNPFNPRTTIRFGLPESGEVKICIINLRGRVEKMLYRGWKQAGYHTLVWNAEDSPTGTYFIDLQAGQYTALRKCILMK